jgi:hypothetical protein
MLHGQKRIYEDRIAFTMNRCDCIGNPLGAKSIWEGILLDHKRSLAIPLQAFFRWGQYYFRQHQMKSEERALPCSVTGASFHSTTVRSKD